MRDVVMCLGLHLANSVVNFVFCVVGYELRVVEAGSAGW